MRVTQSMLSSNMLRNLNTSYGEMSKLQGQIQTGSKISKPSDDPVIAVRGMDYRTQLSKVEQYTRNTNEVNSWLDTSDAALDQVGKALIRTKELIVQAANDTNTSEDREKILSEIKQLRLQLQDIGNTKVSGDYVFSGTKTNTALFKEGSKNLPLSYDPTATPSPDSQYADHVGLNNAINVDVFDGIQLQMNTPAKDVFFEMDDFMDKLSSLLADSTKSGKDISDALGSSVDPTISGTTIPALDKVYESVLTKRADIGARMNRLEMMENRLDIQTINVTKQMSNNEDVDYAKAITEMTTAESIHQAALSTGAKIIQQTLVDFIR